MHVLLVTEPGENGAFRYVDGLARFLLARRVGVHLAYSDRRSGEQLPALVRLVEEHGGATLNLATGNASSLRDVPAFMSLLALVRRVRPDVIHSHSSKAGVLARVLRACGVSARQFYHPHAYAGMRPEMGWRNGIYNVVECVLGFLGQTVAVSSDEEAFASERLGLPRNHVVRIANGVDTRVFRPSSRRERAELRASFGLPPDAVVLGSLSRASAQKDPLTLYRAVAAAAEQCPELVLFHVGCGELDAELDRLAAAPPLRGRVVRRPFHRRPEEFYRALDGFILTSQYEGLSLAALEALATDLPLILSAAPGNHGLLALPLTHAHSAPPGDVGGFARAITDWAADRARPRRPSNHRRIALDQFDSARCFGRVLDLYARESRDTPAATI